MNPPDIRVEDLNFSINGHTILKDVNLTVERRGFLAVIGPNGGGKTTLLKLMLGLLRPDKGKIEIFGGRPGEFSHRIGYVTQHIETDKHFPISVFDVALMGRLTPGIKRTVHRQKDKTVVEDALRRMDMWQFRDHRIGQLSGGQRQRVLIARALASEPDMLFLDEPTASVDATGQTEFYNILKTLNEKITILVVTHDMMVVSSFVKSVACVNESLYFHDSAEITDEMVDKFHCSVELLAHGIPHRVLKNHSLDDCTCSTHFNSNS